MANVEPCLQEGFDAQYFGFLIEWKVLCIILGLMLSILVF
jgi:hypothetical protein